MNETTFNNFNNFGYLMHRFGDEELAFLREEVQEIKSNFDAPDNIPHNKNLAGNIQYEYRLPKSTPKIEQLLIPFFNEYDRYYKFTPTLSYNTHAVPFALNGCWVNFQKKHEFNPVHFHDGIISFVLYLDVPYSIEDEQAVASSINSRLNVPAHFSFFYTDTLGQIRSLHIPVDRTYRNVLLMFPAKMSHCVYPFYTSDEYRISVSGNFVLNTLKANAGPE